MTRILGVFGCLGLSAAAAAEPPSFSRDVAPILDNYCVSCHRPGELAPQARITVDGRALKTSTAVTPQQR